MKTIINFIIILINMQANVSQTGFKSVKNTNKN